MRQWVFIIGLCAVPALLPVSGAAQDSTPQGERPPLEGFNDLADGMRKLFEQFSNDVTPMLDDLTEQLRGLSGYHPPEVLPNGDIIIRRKEPVEEPENAPSPPEPLEPDADGAIDI